MCATFPASPRTWGSFGNIACVSVQSSSSFQCWRSSVRMDGACSRPTVFLTVIWFSFKREHSAKRRRNSSRYENAIHLQLSLQADMMLWSNSGHHLLSLAALLVIVSCGGGDQRRGTESGSTGGGSSSSSSSGGSSSNNYSNRRFHKIQHGQCTYTFILPEGEGARGGSCREAKAGTPQHNANSLQRDAPPPEADFPTQKIQQLEHIMENYTQWLQKVRRVACRAKAGLIKSNKPGNLKKKITPSINLWVCCLISCLITDPNCFSALIKSMF